MQKSIYGQLCELEAAITRTQELADEFTSRVANEQKRLDAVSVKLVGLQGLLNQAGTTASEIRTDLER